MLKTIQLKSVRYAIGEKPILQGVSFNCTEKERVCIFGENGAGKSTLFKIICGLLEPDEGAVQKQGHIRFVYVPQEFDQSFKDRSIDAYIKGYAGETLYKRAFSIGVNLGFDLEKNREKLCGSLSGGQQKILALSTAFAENPDFILLDEPENHLDIVSRKELITLMGSFRGGMIFISHDRLIIDTVATKVGELALGNLHISEGGYDDYIKMKMERIGGLQRQFDTKTKRIKQLSSSIVILKQKALRGKEISAYKRAKEELDELKQEQKENGRPDDRKTRIKISQADNKLHGGKLLCKIQEGSYAYDDTKGRIFSKVNLEVRTGSKIVLLGRNGSGKSTFLKCLTGELTPTHGDVTWADDISWAYFDQHAEFDPEANSIEIASTRLKCTDAAAQAALGAMKFDVGRMKAPVKALSGGERMRLRFAITFGLKPDFIILDEPTNHIDEVTWEILLETCKNSKSSILLVTHDYEFIQEFDPTLFWVIHNRKILARHKDLDTLLEELKG
ncbi:MAG: ABC-F family ATP-binding cassette domain-containing protein [bacterium]|nr:ABC-F family ATP-binding cassette domain-containing protein [bacterium]